MSGLEYSRAVLDRRLPWPTIGNLMGFSPLEFEEGRSLFRGQPGEEHANPLGTVHGGFAATLLDTAIGSAVQTVLPAGIGFTTIDLSVTFVRTITTGSGPALCEGRILYRGRTVATAQAHLSDEGGGHLLAHATGTCLLFEVAE